MSEMVERMAVDLWNAGWATPWEEVDEHTKELTRDQVRAAIKAMMEPTQVMLDAAYTAEQDYEILAQHDNPTREKRFAFALKAALAAALEDPKEG